MKILVAADLHYREQWFRLLERSRDYDLICIAGDLLDMFNAEPRIVQARTVSRWIRELAKVTRVAICSGNHDNAGTQISTDRAPVYEWLCELGKDPRIITDGSTEVLGDLIIFRLEVNEKFRLLDGIYLQRARERQARKVLPV
jgi:predicted phosphodiesterase